MTPQGEPRQRVSLSIRIARALVRWGPPEGTRGRGPLQAAATRYLEWNRQLLLDPQLRYRAAVRLLQRLADLPAPKILDVGSGPAGLAYFLKQPVVGVDVDFALQDLAVHPSPIVPVRASATMLPFHDRSFDGVVSMDTIEHLPKEYRALAIKEMLRVARRVLVIGFPFGPASAGFDREALLEERLRGNPLNWREEHVRHGLPDEETHRALVELARRYRPDLSVIWYGQEGLLGLRLRWRLQWIVSKDSRLYGLVFAPLYWVHSRGWRRHAYRRVYSLQAEPA